MRAGMWMLVSLTLLIGCRDSEPDSSAGGGSAASEHAPADPGVDPGYDDPAYPAGETSLSETPAANGQPAEPIATTAESLWADAAANADKWNKQPVEVSGTVAKAGEEFPGQTYLLLKVSGELTGLMCRFSDNPQPWATAVPGQEVTLRGTCHVLAGEPVVEQCSFVKVGAGPEPIAAADLAASYAANREGAWDAYREKTLVVTGQVKAVEDRGSARVVVLEGNEMADVECWFASKDKNQAAKIAAGDQAKVVGNLIASTSDSDRNFPLSNCLLITQSAAVEQ